MIAAKKSVLKTFMKVFMFFIVSAVYSQGFDFGLITDTQTSFSLSQTWDGSQRNTQRIWAGFDSSSFSFRTQARLTTALGFPDFVFEVDPDLEVLKFQWLGKYSSPALKETDIQVGRIGYRDPSQLVLSSTLDGFLLGFTGTGWKARMGAGYNGFLSKKSSSMALTNSDITDQGNSKIFFASPRAAGLVEGTWLYSENHQASFTYIPHLDLRKLVTGSDRTLVEEGDKLLNSVEGGLLNTHYGVLNFKGTLSKGLYYGLSGVLQTGSGLYYDNAASIYRSAIILGTAASASFDWYAGDSLKSVFHLQGTYTSGDTTARKDYKEGARFDALQDRLEIFKSLSSSSPGYLFSPQWGNISLVEVSYTMKALASARAQDGLTASLTSRSFFRNTEGPVSSSRLLAGGTGNYLGTEAVVILKYRPVSDLSLSFTSGIFILNASSTGPFDLSQSGVESKTALYLSLSL